MPTYLYFCNDCKLETEVLKRMGESSREEHCIACTKTLTRIYTAPQIMGAKVENAEFNPGLGTVTKNKKHRAEIAKRKGLVEIGNEKMDTLRKEAAHTLNEKLERNWDKIDI